MYRNYLWLLLIKFIYHWYCHLPCSDPISQLPPSCTSKTQQVCTGHRWSFKPNQFQRIFFQKNIFFKWIFFSKEYFFKRIFFQKNINFKRIFIPMDIHFKTIFCSGLLLWPSLLALSLWCGGVFKHKHKCIASDSFVILTIRRGGGRNCAIVQGVKCLCILPPLLLPYLR